MPSPAKPLQSLFPSLLTKMSLPERKKTGLFIFPADRRGADTAERISAGDIAALVHVGLQVDAYLADRSSALLSPSSGGTPAAIHP